ncbi:hypothetical protein R1flu_000722 [Riccia fluitans]|uniref:Uncharacterized protein n=1 Tax=Riccia fluitans TaxID=41844 RepID=A0ABD1Y1A2_9MARC
MDEGESNLGVNRVENAAVIDQGDVQMADNQMITGSAEMLDQLNGEGNWISGTQPYYKGIRERNTVQAKTGGATENFQFDVGIDNNLEIFPALVPTTGQNPFGSGNTLPRENPSEQLGAPGVQLIAQEGIAQQRQLLSMMRPITANDAEQKLQFVFGEIKGGGASKGSPGEVNSTRSFATTAKNAWETPLQLTEKVPKKNDMAGELLRPYLENLDPSWGTNVSEDHLLQASTASDSTNCQGTGKRTEENHVNKAENRDAGNSGEADQKGKEPVKEVGKVGTSQAESSFSTGNRGTIKTGNDGFQLGIYSDGSVAKEDESETDKESDGTRDNGESSDSEMEENMEEERTGNNAVGDFQDILSQDVLSLSKLEEEILLQKEGTKAMNRETSAEILLEAHVGEGTSTMLAFENQAFSLDLTVIEKRRVIDGEDKEGFRRQSGKGRVGLLIHQSFRVLSEGVSGKGYAAWIKLQIGEKEVGIVGIHAPNKRKPRIRAWKWVAELIGTGNWIFMGDLNQVELRTDTLGLSPLLHGKEERVWKSLVLRKDLVDCYMVAAWKKGPRLTRHARRGNLVDRARLDRVYVSDGCSWVDHVNSIQHFGGRTQGDHVPVLVKIALEPLEPQQGEKSHGALGDSPTDIQPLCRPVRRPNGSKGEPASKGKSVKIDKKEAEKR